MEGEAFVERHSLAVARVANVIAADNPGILADDIAQEIWVGLLARVDSLEDRFVELTATRIGRDYARAERTDFEHYSAQAVYTPKEIRAFLETVYFNHSYREEKADLRKGGTITVSLWDLDLAFADLSEAERTAINKQYRDGETGLSDVERKRVQRGVDKLTAAVNAALPTTAPWDHEGPGSRRAMSNARAQAMTGEAY